MTQILPKAFKKIWNYLQNKYDKADIDGLLNECTYLDPRFKSMYIDDVDTALVKDCLVREGVEIIEAQTGQSATGNTTEASEKTSSASTSSNPSKKCKLSTWLKEAVIIQGPSGNPLTPEQKVKKEIEEFDKTAIA